MLDPRSLADRVALLRAAATRMCALAVAIATLGLMTTAADAQGKWPERRITLVVPFGAGTVTDAMARILADQLQTMLGQTVIVENRAGAGSTLGTHIVAKAAPDGYTLMMGGNSSHSAAPALIKNVPYDPIKDFTFIARIGKYPSVLATNPQQPFKTIQELVAYAKANPGKLTYGHGNATGQITGETMKKRLSLNIVRLPYSSNPPAMTDLLGNNIQLMVPDFLTGIPQIRAGKIVPLAMVQLDRSKLLPNVPTFHETVIPGFEVLPWVSLMGPAGLPPDITKTLADAVGTIVKKPEIVEKIEATGTELYYLAGPAFADFVKSDLPRWQAAAKEAGIEPQ